jgi:hypothetical protein
MMRAGAPVEKTAPRTLVFPADRGRSPEDRIERGSIVSGEPSNWRDTYLERDG